MYPLIRTKSNRSRYIGWIQFGNRTHQNVRGVRLCLIAEAMKKTIERLEQCRLSESYCLLVRFGVINYFVEKTSSSSIKVSCNRGYFSSRTCLKRHFASTEAVSSVFVVLPVKLPYNTQPAYITAKPTVESIWSLF